MSTLQSTSTVTKMSESCWTQEGEAEYYAAASATSETLLIREVLLFMGQEVRIELLLDSAAARGTCRREGFGT